MYDAFIARLRSEVSRRVEYERTGTLQVASTIDEAAQLRQQHAHLTRSNVAHSLIDGRELAGLEPSLADDIVSALLIADHGYVAASSLAAALADAAIARGAAFSTARVTAVNERANGAEVVTDAGPFQSDAVVVAAGSWSPQIGGLTPSPAPVKPIRGQLLYLRAPARTASRVIWGSGCYLVPWHDGTVLVGATAEDVGYDESATAVGVHDLITAATDVVPALWNARFDQVRVGLRPMTPDELPIIGASSTMRHVFYATGHYRNGILLAPLTAALVAGLLLDGRRGPELELTQPARFGL
jgi:glycine oxidase